MSSVNAVVGPGPGSAGSGSAGFGARGRRAPDTGGRPAVAGLPQLCGEDGASFSARHSTGRRVARVDIVFETAVDPRVVL